MLGHRWLLQLTAPMLGHIKKLITPHSWGLSGRSWGLPVLRMARLRAAASRSQIHPLSAGRWEVAVGGDGTNTTTHFQNCFFFFYKLSWHVSVCVCVCVHLCDMHV